MPWLGTMSGKDGSPQLKSPLMGSGDGDGPDGVVVDVPGTSAGTSSRSSKPAALRLRYMDFLPSSRRRTDGSMDNFQSLVLKANEWLQRNHECQVTTCESVTWMNTRPELLSDIETVVLSKSVADKLSTHFRRGLRLWLTPRSSNGRHSQTISVLDYVPERSDEISSLINRANKKLDQGIPEGKVVTLETVAVPISNGNVDAGVTWWTENASEDCPYAFVLRIYTIRESRAKEHASSRRGRTRRDHVGIKDFVPHPTSEGYEPFSQLIERSNTWLKDQTDIRVTNMQSVMVQKDNGPHSETGSACFYTMPGLHNDDPVEFFRILRLAYVKPTGETLTEIPIIYPFTFETFTPEIIIPKNGKKKERMERMKECFDRVSSFLKTTDKEVICVETVLNPMGMVVDDSASLECDDQMKWLLTPRLYLSGQITLSDGIGRNGLESAVPERQSSIRRGRSNKDKEPKKESDHPGPIFLRNVVTGHRPYKMLVAFITVFVAITIIVVLSVVYSNT